MFNRPPQSLFQPLIVTVIALHRVQGLTHPPVVRDEHPIAVLTPGAGAHQTLQHRQIHIRLRHTSLQGDCLL
ncbi:MAG: hypothetical protein EHM21_02700 [Chloroflexi bacterium]|nr:MAG: hypothetical protein EHM21_02700 [Chloroflexota bacterium]